MPNKKTVPAIIISVLSLVVLAFTTYATVYEQIISQNNGFFNAIIFGVVLILLFIFITLIARIIGLRPENDASVLVKYFSYILLLAVFVFFVLYRRSYTTSVPTGESIPFKAATYLYNGSLHNGNEIFDYLLDFPAYFTYAARISVLFRIFGATGDVYIMVNIVLMAVLAAFVFLTVELYSNKACAYVAAIIILFMPGNGFIVYSYNTELFVAVIFTVTFYLSSLLTVKHYKNKVTSVILSAVCGYFAGSTISSEPALVFAVIGMFIWVIVKKRQSVASIIAMVIGDAFAIAFYCIIKCVTMKVSFLDVQKGYAYCFNPFYNRKLSETASFDDIKESFLARINNPSRYLSENFYFLTNKNGSSYSDNQAVWLKLADQLVYIFLLLMCVVLIIYLLRNAYNRIIPALSALIPAFIGQLLGGINDVNYFYFTTLIIMLGSCTIYYMYLNHHPDYARAVAINEQKSDLEALNRANSKTAAGDKASAEACGDEADTNTENKDLPANTASDTKNPSMPPSPADIERARALVFIGENDELYEQIKEQERLERINNPIAATKISSHISDTGEYESKEESIEFLDSLDERVEVKEVHEVKAIPASRPVEVIEPVLAESYEYDESYNAPENSESTSDFDTSSAVDYFDEPDSFDKFDENISENLNNDLNNFEFNDNIDEVADKISEMDFGTKDDAGIDAGLAGDEIKNGLLIEDISDDDDVSSGSESFEEFSEFSVNGFTFRKRTVPSVAVQDMPVDKKTARKLEKLKAKQQKERLAREKKASKKSKPEKNAPAAKAPETPKKGEPLNNPLPLPKPHVSKEMDFDYDVGGNDDFDW